MPRVFRSFRFPWRQPSSAFDGKAPQKRFFLFSSQCLSSTCEDTLARSGFCSGDFVYVSSSETPRIPLSALTKPNGSCRDFDEKGPAIASESETPKTESEVRAAGDSNADARANAASSPTSQSAFVAAHNATSSSAEERQKATEETTAASNATGGSTGNGLGSFKAFDAFLKERDFAVHDLPLLNDFSPRELRAGAINRVGATRCLRRHPPGRWVCGGFTSFRRCGVRSSPSPSL